MSRYFKYIEIENGKMNISTTGNMSKLVKQKLGVFDYRDFLFDEDSSIYILVKDLSCYDNNTTIIYKSFDNDCDSFFNGKVIFTKMNENGFASLSSGDIETIKRHLRKKSDGLFEMYYSSFCECIGFLR